jgi:hypothetical protein
MRLTKNKVEIREPPGRSMKLNMSDRIIETAPKSNRKTIE